MFLCRSFIGQSKFPYKHDDVACPFRNGLDLNFVLLLVWLYNIPISRAYSLQLPRAVKRL